MCRLIGGGDEAGECVVQDGHKLGKIMTAATTKEALAREHPGQIPGVVGRKLQRIRRSEGMSC